MVPLDYLAQALAIDDLLAMPPAELAAAVFLDPSLLDDPAVRVRHEGLLNRSSVCSYCGVGCPYTVEKDKRGQDKIPPMSPLGLCVKGKTSLFTGSDKERVKRLAHRGIADDRIRVPMLRGHDGKMKEVSWDEALDRAAWLFLHAREWVASAIGFWATSRLAFPARARVGRAGRLRHLWQRPENGRSDLDGQPLQTGFQAAHYWRELRTLPDQRWRCPPVELWQ